MHKSEIGKGDKGKLAASLINRLKFEHPLKHVAELFCSVKCSTLLCMLPLFAQMHDCCRFVVMSGSGGVDEPDREVLRCMFK